MSKSVREILAPVLEAKGMSQKQLAIAVHEKLAAGESPERAPTIDTVESRLSELMNEKPKGLDFFLTNPLRRSVLAAALGGEVVEEALRRAQACTEERDKARVVIDLVTAGPHLHHAQEVFRQLEEHFLGRPELAPMALLITPSLRDALPNRIQSYVERGIASLVNCQGDVREAIEKHAGPKTVLVTALPQGGSAFARWVALDYDDNRRTFRLDPPKGIENCLAGNTTSLPAPRFPLSRLGQPDPAGPPFAPVGATARALMVELAMGTPVTGHRGNLTIPQRLALGHSLGVDCAASEQEWNASLSTRLTGVSVESGGAALERARTRAEFDPSYCAVITGVANPDGTRATIVIRPSPRVVDELGPGQPYVTLDVTAHRRERLEAFAAEAARLGWDDLTDDPVLSGLAERHLVDADELDRAALEHVRRAILRHRRANPRPTHRPIDPIATLKEALSETRSPLRVRVVPSVATHPRDGSTIGLQAVAEDKVQRPVEHETPAAPYSHAQNDKPRRTFSDVEAAPHLDVDHPGIRIAVTSVRRDEASSAHSPILGPEPTSWVDEILEHLAAQDGGLLAALSSLPATVEGSGRVQVLDLPSEIFERAKQLVAVTRLLATQLVRGSDAMEMELGRVLIPTASGLYAEVSAWVRDARVDATPCCTIDAHLGIDASSYQGNITVAPVRPDALETVLPIFQGVSTGYGTAVTTLGPLVPHAVRWTLPRSCVELRFVGSGLGGSVATVPSLVAAASGAAHALFEKERLDDVAKEEEDDDD